MMIAMFGTVRPAVKFSVEVDGMLLALPSKVVT